jgi:hypothetical protein
LYNHSRNSGTWVHYGSSVLRGTIIRRARAPTIKLSKFKAAGFEQFFEAGGCR